MLELTELLKKVRELELVARKNAYSLLGGMYTTNIRGRGMLFDEARKYVFGESIRLIDWNITARLGEPYVKEFQDERERDIFIALDVSRSMYTGWQDQTKIEYAVEMAATLSVSAMNSGDRFGYIIFTDRTLSEAKPARGKSRLFIALKEFLKYRDNITLSRGKTDIRSAIHAIQRHRGRRFVIFIISDFIDRDIPEDLKYIRGVHDLSLMHIYDPVEYMSADIVRFPANSTEESGAISLISPGEAGSLEEMQSYLKNECFKYGLSFSSFSTKKSVRNSLAEFFRTKRLRKK